MSYYAADLSSDSSSSDDGSIDSVDDHKIAKPQHSASSALGHHPSPAFAGGTGSTSSRKRPQSYRDQDGGKGDVDGLWARCILHLDIDCFYCQCEELDRGYNSTMDSTTASTKHPPLAIGQKHIVVTCNYEARKWGVSKLQLKQEAKQKCPSLVIVEGSDLEHYRRYSHQVYTTFRRILQDLGERISNDKAKIKVQVRKGSGMDEMMADLSSLVDGIQAYEKEHPGNEFQFPPISSDRPAAKPNLNIFGDSSNETNGEKYRRTVLVEDQTGAASTISVHSSANKKNHLEVEQTLPMHRRNVHSDYPGDKPSCRRNLEIASDIAQYIQQCLLAETGFYTSAGLSVSPLLSKLGILHKPYTCNVLLPWRSPLIWYDMPLRKIPSIGSRCIKALHPELKKCHGDQEKEDNDNTRHHFWKVRDLLLLPERNILQALGGLSSVQDSDTSREIYCELMISLCRGLDDTPVVDDHGGLTQTVSCEESFMRGTMTNFEMLRPIIDNVLSHRLPRILKDRISWSSAPELAYPRTIRLTVRKVVCKAPSGRSRPFVTNSKQSPLDGKALLKLQDDHEAQGKFLKPIILSLFNALMDDPSKFDITRFNVAVCNFHDLGQNARVSPSNKLCASPPRKDRIDNHFTQDVVLSQVISPPIEKSMVASSPKSPAQTAATKPVPSSTKVQPCVHKDEASTAIQACDIDPEVLAELPPDIAAQVQREYHLGGSGAKAKKKPKLMHDFFRPKSKS